MFMHFPPLLLLLLLIDYQRLLAPMHANTGMRMRSTAPSSFPLRPLSPSLLRWRVPESPSGLHFPLTPLACQMSYSLFHPSLPSFQRCGRVRNQRGVCCCLFGQQQDIEPEQRHCEYVWYAPPLFQPVSSTARVCASFPCCLPGIAQAEPFQWATPSAPPEPGIAHTHTHTHTLVCDAR